MPVAASFEDLPENAAFATRYARRELLGAGGAGEVHVYSDAWIGRDVALKVLRQVPGEGSSRVVAERFFREARLQEQLEGGEVDHRADVYALGAILFEILTRQPLHPRERPVDAVASTRHGAQARPSVRCSELGIAPEFDAILTRVGALGSAGGGRDGDAAGGAPQHRPGAGVGPIRWPSGSCAS